MRCPPLDSESAGGGPCTDTGEASPATQSAGHRFADFLVLHNRSAAATAFADGYGQQQQAEGGKGHGLAEQVRVE